MGSLPSSDMRFLPSNLISVPTLRPSKPVGLPNPPTSLPLSLPCDQAELQAYQVAALAGSKCKSAPVGGGGAGGGGAGGAAMNTALPGKPLAGAGLSGDLPASPFAAPGAQAAAEGGGAKAETALALYGRQDHAVSVRAPVCAVWRILFPRISPC